MALPSGRQRLTIFITRTNTPRVIQICFRKHQKNTEISLEGITRVLWRVTAYRNELKDMIQWADLDGDYTWTPENVGRARIKGLELEAGCYRLVNT